MTIYKNLRQKYGKNTTNIIREYTKNNKKMANLKSSTTFLIRCRQAGIIPRFISHTTMNVCNIFLQNDVTSLDLKRTLKRHIYNFHMIILKLLIQQKHKQIFKTQRELEKLKKSALNLLSEQDINPIIRNENTIFEHKKKQNYERLNRKLKNLEEEQMREIKINFNKDWFINNTDYEIPTNIKWLLSLGPKFALPYGKNNLPIFKCIADGEYCVQTIEEKEKQEMARTKFVTLFEDYKKRLKLDKRDTFILNTVKQTKKFLSDNPDLIILNSDKGNKTVTMYKKDYDIKMKKIIGDICTYRRIKRDPTYTLQMKNNTLVEKLYKLNLIDLQTKNKLINKTANAPRIYGLPKVHKEDIPLRPICSSINSPSYDLCKYIVDILKNLTRESIYNVKDTIEFRSRVENTTIDDDEMLVSFDVISLFPSIPVNLAIKTIENKWDKLEQHTNIPKRLFLDIITFCIKDCSYFKFNEHCYQQNKGLPMGSPASPIIADIIMEELLNTTTNKMDLKPRIFTKYVDDLFGIVKADKIQETLEILNSFNKQIQFTMEKESENKLPYLDALVVRDGNILKLDWYQKPMASGRLVNFYSKHPKNMIINTAKNFINRVLDTSSVQFHRDNKKKIYGILMQNNFPDRIIKNLLDQVKKENNKNGSNRKPVGEPIKFYSSVNYIPGLSERIKHSDIYNKEKYILTMRSNNTTGKLFTNTKSRLNEMDEANLVYKITCNGDDTNVCQKVYVGTTKTKLKNRISSHKSDIKNNDKNLNQKTALAAHCAITGHKPDFSKVKILEREQNYTKRYFKEMLHIINIPTEKRINFKTDTDNCAHIYRHVINKHRTEIEKSKQAISDKQ